MEDYLKTALLFGVLRVAPSLKTFLLHLGGNAGYHSLYTLSPFPREGEHLPTSDLHSFLLSHPRSHSLSQVCSFAFLCLPSFLLLLFFCLASTVPTSHLNSQLSLAPQPSSIEMTHRDKDSVKFELSQSKPSQIRISL